MISERRNRGLRVVLVTALALGALAGPALNGRADPGERDDLRSDVSALENDLAATLERYEATRAKVESLSLSVARTELAVRVLARKMLAREKSAIDLAGELYKGGSAAALVGLLSSGSLAQADTNLKYLESTGQRHSRVFERLAADYRVLERRLDVLDAARRDAVAAQADLAKMQRAIARSIDNKQQRLDEIAAEISAAEISAAELAAAARPSSLPTSFVAIPPPPRRATGRIPDWEAIAQCESGGRWHLDSTYDGGLQFHPMTWLGYGGGKYARYAWQASKAEQIAIAERVLAAQGPGAWPHCFRWK